jgi:hypothetical protein
MSTRFVILERLLNPLGRCRTVAPIVVPILLLSITEFRTPSWLVFTTPTVRGIFAYAQLLLLFKQAGFWYPCGETSAIKPVVQSALVKSAIGCVEPELAMMMAVFSFMAFLATPIADYLRVGICPTLWKRFGLFLLLPFWMAFVAILVPARYWFLYLKFLVEQSIAQFHIPSFFNNVMQSAPYPI